MENGKIPDKGKKSKSLILQKIILAGASGLIVYLLGLLLLKYF